MTRVTPAMVYETAMQLLGKPMTTTSGTSLPVVN